MELHENHEPLTDSYGRIHDYLRISLTDKCNFRCTYCMPHDLPDDLSESSAMMRPEEIEHIAGIFVANGVKKIRLTGGEPLVRKHAAGIMERLAQFPVELAISTNGILLDRFFDVFQSCGIRSLNISLDTLDADRFREITYRNQFQEVMNNIRLAVTKGFHVKVNVVVMKGINDDEIPAFVEWTRHEPIHVRFIEFMPFTGNAWEWDKVVGYREIVDRVKQHMQVLKLEDTRHETSKKFMVPGFAGTFAVISTMTDSFCGDCNRMRLTAEGRMKNCLFSATETDLLTPFRNGEDITPLIRQSILDKKPALGGQFSMNDFALKPEEIYNRSMIRIGG